jgi:uncharacterized membrane protein YbhN (UPF0104 family)
MWYVRRRWRRGERVTAATVADSTESSPKSGGAARRITLIVIAVISAGAFANLLGWDIRAWFEELWDVMKTISAQHVAVAVILMTVQTTATAFAWFTILRFAYPEEVRWRIVWASYSLCVALNNVLPANLGTIVMFVMLTTLIVSATFGGIVTGFLVEKIFFTVAACFVYLYLFLSVPGSFDISFSWIKENPWATVVLVVGVVGGIALLIRAYWPKVVRFWEKAKAGGKVLQHPGAYFGKVFFPSFVGWAAGLGITATFMGAYGIPVTFHTVMSVTGSNSIANSVSVTPGGAGVQQVFNVAALKDVTDSTTATAFSLSQQLISTAYHILLALVLVLWVFGWAGGKALVAQSYTEAKERAARQKAEKEAEAAAQAT